uniref:Uncharacterized protein n=1 Tax=viral metagenome TaxID=1070528 RepID=A0A6M3K3K2_9ZZZZ
MNKTKTWFQKELVKYRNDPGFLREYILLLEDEIECLTNRSGAEIARRDWEREIYRQCDEEDAAQSDRQYQCDHKGSPPTTGGIMLVERQKGGLISPVDIKVLFETCWHDGYIAGALKKYSIFYDIVSLQRRPKLESFVFDAKDCKYFGWKRGIILKWLWFWIHIYQRHASLEGDNENQYMQRM